MRITVLGKSPAWQDADGACSGYLVEDAQTRVLLDCGSGVFSKLRRFRDYAEIDAVVVSHMHADHFLDVIPFACALSYGPRSHPARPTLALPPGAAETVRAIVGCGGQPGLIDGAFDVREYDVAQELRIGSLRLRFRPVPHFIPANAIEVSSSGGPGRFTYGADHGPTDALRGFADGTDLLMLEATLPAAQHACERGHLTPAEAGALAARVGAARLVLTHISDELDLASAREQARRCFDGPVEVAREGAVYSV